MQDKTNNIRPDTGGTTSSSRGGVAYLLGGRGGRGGRRWENHPGKDFTKTEL